MKERISQLLSPFDGFRNLFGAIFTPRSTEGLEEFNIISEFAARGCLLIGGVTSMGYTYLISYSILLGILGMPTLAHIVAIAVVLCLFVVFDGFLGATWTLWTKFWVQGRFKRNKAIEGNNLMIISGIAIFLICITIATISISFSYQGAEVPVMVSLSPIAQSNSDSAATDLSKAFAAQMQLKTIIESYDKKLEDAKKIDKQTMANLKKRGANKVREAQNKYKGSYRLSKHVENARKDSTAMVDSYESQYLIVQRDMENAISISQSSATRLEIAMMEKKDKIQGMFDKKMDISVFLLRWLGVIGTALFMFIKFVQISLNHAVQQTNKHFTSSKTFPSGGSGTRNGTNGTFGTNKNGTSSGIFETSSGTSNNASFGDYSEKTEHRKKSVSEHYMEKRKHEWDIGDNVLEQDQDGASEHSQDSVYVPSLESHIPKSRIKQMINQQAHKYKNAVTAKGKESAYIKVLDCITTLATYDTQGAQQKLQEVQNNFGFPKLYE